MDNNVILMKLKTLHKEYKNYEEYLEKFSESVDEKKKDIAQNMGSESFKKELEKFVLEFFILKSVHYSDLDIIANKLITYHQVVVLLGIEPDEEITRTVNKCKKREMKPKFIIESGKAIEVEVGFVDEQRKVVSEQGNISKLIERATN